MQDLPSTNYDGHIDHSLPLIRLAQAAANRLNNTFMTSLIDHGYLYGPKGSIHPFDKTPVGERLVLSAREHAYDESVVSSGPVPTLAGVMPSGQVIVPLCMSDCL